MRPNLVICAAAVILAFMPGCSSERKPRPPVRPVGSGEFELAQTLGASWNTRFVLAGDFDGDADLDLFFANYGEQNRLLINNGAGEFTDGTGLEAQTTTGLPAAEDLSNHAAAADVDGDGDLDILVANNGQNTLLINDGLGRFTDGTDPYFNMSSGLPLVMDDSKFIAFINVDQSHGDTDMDAIAINNGQNKLLLNDGHGEFLDGTDLAQTFTSGMPVGNDNGQCALVLDIDADGDLDFMTGNIGGPDRIFLNSPTKVTVSPEVWQDGWGEFKETTFDTATNAISLPYYSDATYDVKAANLDMDGGATMDLVLACNGGSRILLNQGSGFFQDAQADWKRERAFVNGGFSALAGVSSHLYAVGVMGQISHNPDGSSWGPEGGVTGNDLLCAAGIPATIRTFAAGKAGVVVENTSGSFVALNQALTQGDLRGCTAFALNNAYFVGDGGTILKWNGSAFSFDYRFSANNLTSVHGGSSSDVTVVGYQDAILQYNGTGWTVQPTNLTAPGTLLGVYHQAADNKYAVGAGGLILRYYNGASGLKWYQQTSPTTYSINSVSGSGPTNVYAVGSAELIAGDYNVMRSDGSSWSFVSLRSMQYLRVNSPSGAYTVGETVIGSSSAANATVLSWDPASRLLLVSVASGVFSVTAPDQVQGQTSGASGTLAYVCQAIPTPRNLNDVYVDSASGEVFIAGEYGTVIHYDGASVWELQAVTNLTVSSPSGNYQVGETVSGSISGATGRVTAWNSTTNVLTVNPIRGIFDYAAPDQIAGQTSLVTSTLTFSGPACTSSLRGIAGTSNTDCFIVGTGPAVQRYTGSGVWTDVTPAGVTANLNAVWVQGNDLYAVGAGGTIISCNTSTMTWNTSITSPVTENLLSIWGSSATDLFACGENGTIIHYNGTNWFVESAGSLNGISASGPNDLWAVGDSGWILHGDGAGHWTPQTAVPSSADLLAVQALTPSDVMAVGRNGTVLRYNGSTWTLSSPAIVDLYAVFAIDATDIFACGDNGTVIFWNGSTWAPYYRTGTAARLTGLWASSISNVWAVGDHATCIHFTGTVSTKGFDAANTAASMSVAIVDIDADGHQDLVFGNLGQNTLWKNAGISNPGRFSLDASGYLPVDSDQTVCLAKGNFNAAWPYQLVAGNMGGQSRLYLRNSGTGHYEDRTDLAGTQLAGLPASFRSSKAAAGDIDGDGDLDVAVAVKNGQCRLYVNSGGRFTDGTANAPYTSLPVLSADSRGMAMADMDRNGHMDIVVANYGSQNRIYLNTGGGVFSDATVAPFFPNDTDATSDVALGDLNNDGYPDIVFANDGTQNKLYLFSSGAYSDQTALAFPVDTAASRAVCLVDVDNDMDLDVLFCNYGGQNLLYLNQLTLTGQFLNATASNLPADTDNTVAAAVGDVNGDGYADIVFVNYGQQCRLLINDGIGRFTDRTDIATHVTKGLPAATWNSTSAVLGDFDGDGDLDLVLANTNQQNRLYLNNASGLFSEDTDELKIKPCGLPAGQGYSNHVLAADFDGDTDLDLFLSSDGPIRVMENR